MYQRSSVIWYPFQCVNRMEYHEYAVRLAEEFFRKKMNIRPNNTYMKALSTDNATVSGAIIDGNMTFTGCVISDAYFHGTSNITFNRCILKNAVFSKKSSGNVIIKDCLAIDLRIEGIFKVEIRSSYGVEPDWAGSEITGKFDLPFDMRGLSGFIKENQLDELTIPTENKGEIKGLNMVNRDFLMELTNKLGSSIITVSTIKDCNLFVRRNTQDLTITNSILENVTLVIDGECNVILKNVYVVDRENMSVEYIGSREIKITGKGYHGFTIPSH